MQRKRTYRRSSAYRSAPRRSVKARTTYRRPVARKRAVRAVAVRRVAAGKPATVGSASYSRIGGRIGETLGGYLAPGIGSSLGGALGSMGGSVVDYVTGKGDYKIHKNTLVKPHIVPSFGKGCVRITHREYVGKVQSTVVFNNTSYGINPGLPQTFPWLSQIANNFEMYKMNGLIFEYVSYSANALNSTNTALGKIVLATDYNALDPPYQDVQQMYATEFCNSGPPAASIMHAVECEPAENPLKLYFIRGGPVSSTPAADLRMYDMGNFQIATQGSQQVSDAGELWVTYDVSLCKPSLQAVDEGETLKAAKATCKDYTSFSGMFGKVNNVIMKDGSNFKLTNLNSAGQLEVDPAIDSGRYLVGLYYVGTANPCTEGTLTLTNANILATYWDNGFFSTVSAPSNGTSNARYTTWFVIDVIGSGVVMAFNAYQLPTSVTSLDIMMVQIPSDLVP